MTQMQATSTQGARTDAQREYARVGYARRRDALKAAYEDGYQSRGEIRLVLHTTLAVLAATGYTPERIREEHKAGIDLFGLPDMTQTQRDNWRRCWLECREGGETPELFQLRWSLALHCG